MNQHRISPGSHPPSRFLLTVVVGVLLLTASRAAPLPPLPPCALVPSPVQAVAAGIPDVPSSALAFGVNAHLATRYPDPSSMQRPAALLSELGVSWVREDFHWYRVQPRPGVWDWTFNDAAVHELDRRDMAILGVIGGPSAPWATPFSGDSHQRASFYAPDPEAFVAFAQAVVSRYHQTIHHWEIWNEPDNPLFWKPHPDPQAYARLLIRTSAAIKAVDPEATVLIGGFNPFDLWFVREVLRAGAWSSFDLFAIHPYVDPTGPEAGNLTAAADGVRALAAPYGSKPIWATEIGWSSGPGDHDPFGVVDEQQQARFLVRALLLLREAGVERSFWYTFKDDPDNPYGLVRYGTGRADYTERKPAFTAFQMLNHQLDGASFIEQQDPSGSTTYTTVLEFDGEERWHRPVQPNGTLRSSGVGTARLDYHFSTRGNDYVAFELFQPQPIALALEDQPRALGVWVYGDGSGHRLNAWVRDREGETLQLHLGVVGAPGWRFLSVPLRSPIRTSDRIAGEGNGQLDFPVALAAVVLDDCCDTEVGVGTVYLDRLTAITGPERFHLRFEQGGDLLEVLWSLHGGRVSLPTTAARGYLVACDGSEEPVTASKGRFSLVAGPAPLFVRHRVSP